MGKQIIKINGGVGEGLSNRFAWKVNYKRQMVENQHRKHST
jgi:hypothetical protein